MYSMGILYPVQINKSFFLGLNIFVSALLYHQLLSHLLPLYLELISFVWRPDTDWTLFCKDRSTIQLQLITRLYTLTSDKLTKIHVTSTAASSPQSQ